jgi:hypothetical protein
MTRSENMRRLWADPEWADRARARLSTTASKTLGKLWADPGYRARAAARRAEANRQRRRDRIDGGPNNTLMAEL